MPRSQIRSPLPQRGWCLLFGVIAAVGGAILGTYHDWFINPLSGWLLVLAHLAVPVLSFLGTLGGIVLIAADVLRFLFPPGEDNGLEEYLASPNPTPDADARPPGQPPPDHSITRRDDFRPFG